MREQYDSALVRLEETGDSGNECNAGAPAYHSGNCAESQGKRGDRIFEREKCIGRIQKISGDEEEILGNALLVTRLLCKHDRI